MSCMHAVVLQIINSWWKGEASMLKSHWARVKAFNNATNSKVSNSHTNVSIPIFVVVGLCNGHRCASNGP